MSDPAEHEVASTSAVLAFAGISAAIVVVPWIIDMGSFRTLYHNSYFQFLVSLSQRKLDAITLNALLNTVTNKQQFFSEGRF